MRRIYILILLILIMAITHAAIKAPGESGLASEWNADHVISSGLQPKLTATLIVAANDSENTEQADYVCDGVADQAEINTAIAALPANGGRVLLLEGTYNLTSWIIPGNSVTIEGQGYGTRLNAQGIDAVIYAIGKTRIIVKDLLIIGTESGAGDTAGIKFEVCTYSQMIRVYTVFDGDFGLWISGGYRNMISNCYAWNTNIIGIFVSQHIAQTIENIVNDCYAKGGNNGIRIGLDADRNIVEGCIAEGGTDSIFISDAASDRNIIHGNIARDGITDNGTNSVVADNIVA